MKVIAIRLDFARQPVVVHPKHILTFFGLSRSERQLFWRSVLELPKYQKVVASRGFKEAVHFSRQEIPPPPAQLSPREIARMVNGAACLIPWPVRCLARSLYSQSLLRAGGTSSCVVLGVRPLTGAFKAHAWLEIEGVPVNDTNESVGIYTRINQVLENGNIPMCSEEVAWQ